LKRLILGLFLLVFLPLSANEKMVALTFDDGPWLKQTEEILKILDKYKVKATFFVLGCQVKCYPEILRKIVKQGSEIGNHTYYHPDLTKLKNKQIKKEVLETEKLIKKIVGDSVKLTYFRPPYLSINKRVEKVLNSLGYKVIMQTIDSNDWYYARKKDGSKLIVKRVLRLIDKSNKDKEIIVFHDGGGNRKATIQALPIIIKELQKRGYKIVSLKEILKN